MPGGSDTSGQGVPRDGSQRDDALSEIYLEIRQVGKAQRVTAIDPDTGFEVVFPALATTPRSEIETVARNKLAARIAREQAKASATARPVRAERGRLV